MIRRILASIMMFILLSTSMANAYTLEDQTLAKNTLGEYSRYIPLLENSLSKISQEKLEEIQETLRTNLANTDGDTKNFVKYALISIDLELQARSTSLPKIDINSEDILMVENEIMSLQNNLENEFSSFLELAITGWNNASRYEETGNFNMSLDMAVADFIEFKGDISIADYISETQIFDQMFSGGIKSHYYTNVPGAYGGEVDFSFNSDANLIVKDGNVYIKLDKLSSQSTSSNEYFELDMTPFIDKMQELAASNTYVEIPSDDIFSYIQSFVYSDVTSQMKAQMETAFETPLLQVESKTDVGYSLIPTKHFCNIGKKISNIFDPFGGEDCTQGQFDDMLNEFRNSGMDITLTMGEANTLSMSMVDSRESMSIDISWNQDSITQIAGVFLNTSSPYYGDRHVNFDFKPNTSFNVSLGDDEFNTYISLLMDQNGNIYSGEYSLDVDDVVAVQGNYKNKNLSLSLEGQDDDIEVACLFSGPMKKDFLNISGGCDIYSPDIEDEIPGVQEIRIDSTLSYDARNGSNNVDISLNTHVNQGNYLDFSLSNTGLRRNIGAREIQAPEKTKNIEEVFDEVYQDIYSDYNYDYYDDSEYTFTEYDDYTQDCYTYESGDYTCYKYYDDKSETCNYTVETDDLNCSEYVYSDWEYETKEYAFDDHTTTCYLYNSGDTTCYEYYEDKSTTCIYTVETDETDCSTYEYGYRLIETEHDDYTQTCYNYDTGDYTCYKYYDDKDETCYYYAETDELDCDTYEYDSYDYYDDSYYDDYYYGDIEDAQDAAEDEAIDAAIDEIEDIFEEVMEEE